MTDVDVICYIVHYQCLVTMRYSKSGVENGS